MKLPPTADPLASRLSRMGRVLLGYSGGVDSSLLAVVATRTLGPDRFLAVIGVSASLASDQHQNALTLAREFGVPLRELATDELADPNYASNPHNRCYFCKRTLWRHVGALASKEGWDTIIDGTNADDLMEHRPGALAGTEHRVRTPLADLGWTKADVRSMARQVGVPNWDAPAAPCLASRIKPLLPVTAQRLAQVEAAEVALRNAGVVGDLRVRHHGTMARIEVAPEMFALVDAEFPQLLVQLKQLGFESVERDTKGYRRGALSGSGELP